MANNKTSRFFNMAIVLAVLLTLSLAEGHRIFGVGFLKSKSTPLCETVIGVKSGDTCSAIAQQFGLTTDFFDSINPNVNCDALFVGQWICVAGSV